MDYQAELIKVEKTLNDRKMEHARMEGRLKTMKEDIDKKTKELTDMGVDVSTVDDFIKSEEGNISKIIAEIKNKLGI